MRHNQQQIACRVIYHRTNFESQNVSHNTDLCNCNEIKQPICICIVLVHDEISITITYFVLLQ